MIDWWLADIDFITSLECHDEEVRMLRLELQQEFDALDDRIYSFMVDAMEDGIEVSEAAFEQATHARNLLVKKSKVLEEAIEKEAIKIGL